MFQNLQQHISLDKKKLFELNISEMENTLMEQERLLSVQQIYSTIEPQDHSVKEVQKHNFNQLALNILKLKKLTAIIKQQQLIPPQTDEPSQDIVPPQTDEPSQDRDTFNRIYTVPVAFNVSTVLFFNIAFNEVKKLRRCRI